ncbi:hypothetical protein PSHT_12074, partial [Puccinia striiformis]
FPLLPPPSLNSIPTHPNVVLHAQYNTKSKRRSNSRNLEALPPSPEVTGDTTLKKPKASTSERRDQANTEKQQVLNLPSHCRHMPPLLKPHLVEPPRKMEQEIRAAAIEKEMVNYKEAQFHLKQTKLVLATIQAANSQFRSDNVLKANGSNFGDWCRNISDVGSACLTGSHFFFNKCNNNTFISSSGHNLASAHPPLTLATSVSDEETFNISAYLADVDEEEWVDALDFFAITSNKCWQCGNVNHYARNCPDKSKRPAAGNDSSQLKPISQNDHPKDPHPPFQKSRTGLEPS